jgi:sugar lactone lactonase YvrE
LFSSLNFLRVLKTLDEKIAVCGGSGYDGHTKMVATVPGSPQKRPRSPLVRHYLGFLGSLLICGSAHAGGPAKQTPVVPGPGWRFEVIQPKLPGVDSLAVGVDGSIYATRERGAGRGQVVRIRKGRAEPLLNGLNFPDGLRLHGNLMYVTEETADGRVLEFDLVTRRRREIARLYYPEGIAILPGGDLAVAEDNVNGRIVHLNAHGVVDVVTTGLNRPEGLVAGADGTLFFCETATGRVIAWRDGDMKVLLDDLEDPDQIALGPDGALWITEDARPGRLLRYQDGKAEVILSGLWAPQGIAPTGPRSALIAEKGRGRILLVNGAKR